MGALPPDEWRAHPVTTYTKSVPTERRQPQCEVVLAVKSWCCTSMESGKRTPRKMQQLRTPA